MSKTPNLDLMVTNESENPDFKSWRMDLSGASPASNMMKLDAAIAARVHQSEKGSPGGVAELDASGKILSSQLPSYVDDVIEAASFAALPEVGEAGKIYVTLDENKTYRWGGTGYVEISAGVTLGETSLTAYRGDRGKLAYEHSQVSSGNPHGTAKSDVGLGNVPNVATNDQTPTFEESATVLDIESGDKLSVLFGKIKKSLSWIRDNFVPTTRKINGKALSGDIALTAEDVGAMSEGDIDVDELSREMLPESTELAIFGNAANRTVGEALVGLQRNMSAKLLYEKWTSGSFSWTAPPGVTRIGVMLGGAGGSGGSMVGTSGYAAGGGAGELIQYVMSVLPTQSYHGVIGSGGMPAMSTNGNSGGSSSFNGRTVDGGIGGLSSVQTSVGAASGQAPDRNHTGGKVPEVAPYGGRIPFVRTSSNTDMSVNTTVVFINLFDTQDHHIYCGAGAACAANLPGKTQKVSEREKGHSGEAKYSELAGDVLVNSAATAPGDGGGACSIMASTGSATSGAGAPGFIRIYDLTGREEAGI